MSRAGVVLSIREAMNPVKRSPIGGQGRTVESDETVIGGKTKNRAYATKEPKKHTVLALVDRDGLSYSFHIANVKATTLRQTIVKVASRESYLMTDEPASYAKLGQEFSGHGTVNHSANEYVRGGGFWHVNTTECRFILMKRAVFGTHHSISEAHLPRYLAEWDFKWNTRKRGTCGARAQGRGRQASHVACLYRLNGLITGHDIRTQPTVASCALEPAGRGIAR